MRIDEDLFKHHTTATIILLSYMGYYIIISYDSYKRVHVVFFFFLLSNNIISNYVSCGLLLVYHTVCLTIKITRNISII